MNCYPEDEIVTRRVQSPGNPLRVRIVTRRYPVLSPVRGSIRVTSPGNHPRTSREGLLPGGFFGSLRVTSRRATWNA
jgi:hypothetical protein